MYSLLVELYFHAKFYFVQDCIPLEKHILQSVHNDMHPHFLLYVGVLHAFHPLTVPVVKLVLLRLEHFLYVVSVE